MIRISWIKIKIPFPKIAFIKYYLLCCKDDNYAVGWTTEKDYNKIHKEDALLIRIKKKEALDAEDQKDIDKIYKKYEKQINEKRKEVT